MKYLWGELGEIETRALMDHPGVLEDKLFIAALRATMHGVPKTLLSSRLRWVSEKLETPRLDLDLLKTWNKLCTYDLQELDFPISKPKKYSGYVKSPSAVGSKRRPKSFHVPEIFEWSVVNDFDLFHILAVGEFIGESMVILLPDEEPNRFETAKKSTK